MNLKSNGMITQGRRWLQAWQRARYRRRVRRAIQRTAVRFGEQYPEWRDFFFDAHFLLNRGMPIIERHLAAATATDAMDLTLAWAEQLPQMRAERRKCHLQALTPLATEFLHLLESELTQPGPVADTSPRADGVARPRIGVPAGYVRANC